MAKKFIDPKIFFVRKEKVPLSPALLQIAEQLQRHLCPNYCWQVFVPALVQALDWQLKLHLGIDT
jgi:hypothetical protein